MAVHVVGRAPVADAGEYYRIPFERWRPVLAAVRAEHGGLINGSVLEGMVYNHGAGVVEHNVCLELATRLREALASPRWSTLADDLLRADVALQSLTVRSGRDASGSDHRARRAQLDEDVERWISFLDSCGGFAVW